MCLPNVVHYLPVGNYMGSKTVGKPLDDRHGTGSNRMITCPGCISCPQQTCITPSFLDQEPWDDSESHGLQSRCRPGLRSPPGSLMWLLAHLRPSLAVDRAISSLPHGPPHGFSLRESWSLSVNKMTYHDFYHIVSFTSESLGLAFSKEEIARED